MVRKILIAEDDPGTRTVIRAALQQEGYETFVASDGLEGRQVFDRVQPDMLITDLDMPNVDGFTLIAHVINTRPSVPVVVVSGIDRGRVQERLTTRLRIAHIGKPIDLERLRLTVNHYASSTGNLQGVTLFGFLQMLNQERKSCALRVESGAKEGLVCLEGGDVIDAYAAGLQGVPAAFEILSWPSPRIEIVAPRELVSRSIEISTLELLLEAARAMDESNLGGVPPDLDEWDDGAIEETSTEVHLACPVDLLSVGECLAGAMQIEGARAAAVFDGRNLQPFALVRLETPRLERMRELVRSLFQASAPEADGVPESAVITRPGVHWVIRRKQKPDVFLVLVLDRSEADLRGAMSRLTELESVIHS